MYLWTIQKYFYQVNAVVILNSFSSLVFTPTTPCIKVEQSYHISVHFTELNKTRPFCLISYGLQYSGDPTTYTLELHQLFDGHVTLLSTITQPRHTIFLLFQMFRAELTFFSSLSVSHFNAVHCHIPPVPSVLCCGLLHVVLLKNFISQPLHFVPV